MKTMEILNEIILKIKVFLEIASYDEFLSLEKIKLNKLYVGKRVKIKNTYYLIYEEDIDVNTAQIKINNEWHTLTEIDYLLGNKITI